MSARKYFGFNVFSIYDRWNLFEILYFLTPYIFFTSLKSFQYIFSQYHSHWRDFLGSLVNQVKRQYGEWHTTDVTLTRPSRIFVCCCVISRCIITSKIFIFYGQKYLSFCFAHVLDVVYSARLPDLLSPNPKSNPFFNYSLIRQIKIGPYSSMVIIMSVGFWISFWILHER